LTVPDFEKTEIVIPPNNLMHKFTTTITPMFDEIRETEQETRALASIRDALLPRLLSGEIEVEGEK
jgi:type I restriction enzyme S subunit